jgi:hypothetical protein
MTNSDQTNGWDGVERRVDGKPRRVSVIFSVETSRKDRSEPYTRRVSYPNNRLNVPQGTSASTSVAEI